MKNHDGLFMLSEQRIPIMKAESFKEVTMPGTTPATTPATTQVTTQVTVPVTEAAPRQAVGKLPGLSSSGDVNRRGNGHWHLDDPQNKALTALVYTSVFKGAWGLVARSSESLFALLRASHRRPFSERSRENGNVGAL
jgi:hypothetical protein